MEGVEKRGLFVFGILVLFTIMFTGFSEAAVTCSSSDQIILRLSDVTNAHGEVWDGAGNYTEEICYDTIFGVLGSGDRTCTGSNKIVGLSGTTNAHAEEPAGTIYTTTEVCYSGLTCTARTGACQAGESLVLSLSSSTNAHLSSGSSYSQNICCSNIPPPTRCGDGIIQTPNDDGVNEECDDDNSGTKCIAPGETNECQCEPGFIPDGSGICVPGCSITSASWSLSGEVVTEIAERISINMIIDGTNECDEESVNFLIAEVDCIFGTCDYGDIDNEDTDELSVDSVSGSFSGTQAVVSWTTEWVKDDNNGLFGDDDPEYVFKAELLSDPSINIDDSGEIKVTPIPVDYCPGRVFLCEDYYTHESGSPIAENACIADTCDVAEFSSEEFWDDDTFCEEEDINCRCGWDATDLECGSVWDEIETPDCGNGVAESGEQCDGSDWGSTITGCSAFSLTEGTGLKCYPRGSVDGDGNSNECKFDTRAPGCTGPSGICGDKTINPGETCDGTPPSGDWGLILSCTNLDRFDFGNLKCGSEDCQFDTNQCFRGGDPPVIGTCVYTSTTTGSCEDDGYLSSSWTAAWTGAPSSRSASCESGSTSIECPAQIQLAFFNLYNMLITLLAIAGIYGIISLRKKH